jgi:hypothetical protein
MGMDVSGLNPVIHKEPTSELLKKDWTTLSEDDLSKYFEDKRQHEADNPGIYFRNNVWWWRPLWDYVWKLCDGDGVMSEDQYKEGHYNSGSTFTIHQAELIALKLNHAIKMGWVDEHMNSRNEAQDSEDRATSYPFDVDNVRDFAEFCKDSGGFSIQ